MRHQTITSDFKGTGFRKQATRFAVGLALLTMVCQGLGMPAAHAEPPTAEQLTANASKSLEAMTDFKDPNFSMKFPTSWDKETDGLPPSQILRAKTIMGAVNLIVVADKSPNAESIDKFADTNVNGLKEAFGDKLTISTNEPIKLKNTTGRLLVMGQEMKDEGKDPIKFKQYMVLFVSNGTGYGMTCTTIDSWYPIFEKVFKAMADSVEVAQVAKTEASAAPKTEASD
ncbi:MAG: hypothetical protein U0105_20870 [Candidatus Obscuribacterales bacterium]